MRAKKTPAPRRAGTAEAETLADFAVAELADDPEALAAVVALVALLAKRSRKRRR